MNKFVIALASVFALSACGVGSLADVLTPTGGTSIAGMLEALNQTEAGKALVEGVVSKLNK